KIIILPVVALGLIAVQAQDSALCRRVHNRCISKQRTLGRENDITRAFNGPCRQANRNWQPVTRCELARATCRLTSERCSTLTCTNVRRALGGSGPGPGPTPRTTTRRPQRPPTRRTTTRRPRRTTTPGIPTPETTTRRGPGRPPRPPRPPRGPPTPE
ncbi:hypothetical protein KR009_008654, partial [Drosophila setifemur]